MNVSIIPDNGEATWFWAMVHNVLKERDPKWYAEYICDPSFLAFKARVERNGVAKGMTYSEATSAFINGFDG